MTRIEFLEKLRAALGNDLSGAIIQENVDYYNNYISEEAAKGRSEAEVIEELGDPWVLAQTIIDSAQGQKTSGAEYDSNYGYEPRQRRFEEEHGRTGHVYSFGLDTWWKKLLLILGIVGVIMVIGAVIGGLVSLLAPVIVPIIIIVIIVRAFNRRR